MIGGALAVGAGFSLLATLWTEAGDDLQTPLMWVMVIGAVLVGLMTVTELLSSHPTTNAATSFHHMTRGRFAREWWSGQALLIVIPILTGVLVLTGQPAAIGALGAVSALVGVFLADDAFVRAGQSAPLS